MSLRDFYEPMTVMPGVTMIDFIDGRKLPARDYVRRDFMIEGNTFPFVPYASCVFERPHVRTRTLQLELQRHALRVEAPPVLWAITSIWTPTHASSITLRYAPNSAHDSGPITIVAPGQAHEPILPIYVEADQALSITQHFFNFEDAEHQRLALCGYFLHPKFEV